MGFHIRPASQSRGDVDFILRAHDSALPFLASVGSAQWGDELFSARPSAVEGTRRSVEQSQANEEGERFVRTFIAEVERDTVSVEGSRTIPADFTTVPCAVASINRVFPTYVLAANQLDKHIDASRQASDFFFLDRLVVDRNVGARAKGAGKVLLDHCKAICRTRGKRYLFADCFAGPPTGLPEYYHAQGFELLDHFTVPSKHTVKMDDVYWTLDLSRPISSSFTYDVGGHGWGNEELQHYTDSPRNAYITSKGDALVICAIAETDHSCPNGRRMTSARLVSKQCLELDQGYVQAHIQAPQGKGIWHAFWLLPKQPFHWPSDGEIDIAEGWNARRENGTCIHWGHFNGQDHDKHRVRYHPVTSDQGHTYGLCWSPKGLVWFFDGRPTMRAVVPPGIRPLAHFQVMLNIAMGGNVMQGAEPVMPSTHQMAIRGLKICRSPPNGWDSFDEAWNAAQEGDTM